MNALPLPETAPSSGRVRPVLANGLPAKIQRLLRIAQWSTVLGLIVFAVAIAVYVVVAIIDGPGVDAMLVEDFLETPKELTLTMPQRLLMLAISFLGSGSGIVGLWQTGRLLADYRKGEIFTLRASARLRFIGWMVVLLMPGTMLAEALSGTLMRLWSEPGTLEVTASIGDGEVFALVFGLLFVVVGHVMYQAIEISEENRAFV